MAHADCPECQAVVDVINRQRLNNGEFTANSAYRDAEMRHSRFELVSDPNVGCACHKEGEVNDG